MADDTIRLELETIDTTPLDKLDQSVKQTTKDIYDFADTYELAQQKSAHAHSVVADFVDRENQALNDLLATMAKEAAAHKLVAAAVEQEDDGVNHLLSRLDLFDNIIEEVTSHSDKAATKVKTIGPAMDGAARSSGNLGRGILEVSRGLEDMQYGLAGVLNNIPSAIQAFGGAAGLAGVVSLVAVGAKVLYDHWDDLKGLFEDRKPIAASAETLDTLSEALKKNKDATDKLRDAGSLNAQQMKKYNDLLKEQVDLESRQAILRETEANKKAHTELSNQEAKERGGGFQKALDESGGYEKVAKAIVDAEAKGATPDMRRSIQSTTEQLLNQALKGDKSAIASIAQASRQDRTGFDRKITQYDPARIKAEQQQIDRANQTEEESIRKGQEQARENAAREQMRRRAAGVEANADQHAEGNAGGKPKFGQQGYDLNRDLTQQGMARSKQNQAEAHDAAKGWLDRAKREQAVSDATQKQALAVTKQLNAEQAQAMREQQQMRRELANIQREIQNRRKTASARGQLNGSN